VPKKPATYQDIIDAPDTMVAEILEGELFVSPRPAFRHSLAGSGLGAEIGGRFQFGRDGPGGWWILDEPELHFGKNVMVPDLAGWRRERMPVFPDTAFCTLAPDWICEVLSPSTETIDRSKKLRLYAAAEVKHAWLLNPLTRTLEVLRLEKNGWLLCGTFANDELVRAEPFEAAQIDLLLLWGETRAK
jgi:Uma2 family endonuclease